ITLLASWRKQLVIPRWPFTVYDDENPAGIDTTLLDSPIAIGAISNPSVSALKMPDQGLFRSDTATKSAISAALRSWLVLSILAIMCGLT
ncbi:hypothetical protein, partial [Microbacterium paulum]|uniref:hypothetical protein n=1 Tax=Microbacterium paulum TaxID=2707006 RepID=UPI0019D68860